MKILKTVKFIKAFHLFKPIINFSTRFRFRFDFGSKVFFVDVTPNDPKGAFKGIFKKMFSQVARDYTMINEMRLNSKKQIRDGTPFFNLFHPRLEK